MEILSGLCEKVEEIGLGGPAFTLGTANSACPVFFCARISGIQANPLKYTDPDGRDINKLFSYSQMGNYPWRETNINGTSSKMKDLGCAITGMANVFTASLNSRGGDTYHTRSLITPDTLNNSNYFYSGTDNLDWRTAAASVGMTASRSKPGNSDTAIASLLSAYMSTKKLFVLIQVPITTSNGGSDHWVGVDGPLELDGNNILWAKVSPTSSNDNGNRLNNSNWRQGSDGSMYIDVLSVKGTVVIE
jgi:hypothetical protein